MIEQKFFSLCLLGVLAIQSSCGLAQPESEVSTLRLHPDNPHYFQFRGRPTILITSAEHYGAVLNRDFDFTTYLDTLATDGLNYTRIFAGTYVEVPGSFGIENNTLAPAAGRFLPPWAASDGEGQFAGESKWDLSRWNAEYFQRLREFIRCADDRDVLVEITLFCSTYQDLYWKRNPLNPANHVNGVSGQLTRQQSTTLANPSLTKVQKRLVEKIVREVSEFDNVFFEIQNEPWADNGVKVMNVLKTVDPKPTAGDWFKWAEMGSDESLKWQQEMTQTIVRTESMLPKKHLIAQNFTNFKHSLTSVPADISILNYHYAWPEVVQMNWGWNRPIGFDESGFSGSDDDLYLVQAWRFVVAGGALFNHLDYSFFVAAETGEGKNSAPGGGSPDFRKRLVLLKSFIEGFDLLKMGPDSTAVYHSPGFEWQAISEPGRQYAIFFSGVGSQWVDLKLPAGEYDYRIVSPLDGKLVSQGRLMAQNADDTTRLTLPITSNGQQAIAVRITRKD